MQRNAERTKGVPLHGRFVAMVHHHMPVCAWRGYHSCPLYEGRPQDDQVKRIVEENSYKDRIWK